MRTAVITENLLKTEIQVIRRQAKERYVALKENYESYKEYVELEIEIQAQIAEQTMRDKEQYLKKIKELKGIIRIPRLYEQYKAGWKKLMKLKEQEQYVLDGYMHNNGLTYDDLREDSSKFD
tara:strand:- start:322 stop:687 length:366 start_codon:yes stop_codon:yes gene_type:complete